MGETAFVVRLSILIRIIASQIIMLLWDVTATLESIAGIQSAIITLEKEKREITKILSRANRASKKSAFGNSPTNPELTSQI
jgi:hypothetical protein